MSYLAYYAYLRVKIAQQKDTTLVGRGITGPLATRSKGSTRKFGLPRQILLDDADDEVEEGGVGHSINIEGEDEVE